MASPDFSQYVNLTVNDLQPVELYAAAVDYARTAFPEFEPRSGSVEEALLQAFAYINSVYSAAANRIPNGTIEGVLRLFGLERREAGVSTVNAQFTILTPGGSVEQGTAVSYLDEVDGEVLQYSFFVTETAFASGSSTSVNVVLESIVVGPLPAIPIGSSLIISQVSSELLTCVTTSVPTTVSTAESETEYLTRGVTFLQSLSSSLCTASQIEKYIVAAFPSVTRCKVYDLAYGSATAPVATTTTTLSVNGSNADAVIDCGDERDGMFKFNDSLGLDIDDEAVWITSQASFGSETITSDIFPSGLIVTSGSSSTAFDYTTKTISIDGIPVVDASTADAGQTMVQLVSGLQYSTLNGTPPGQRTPDARGMYVIYVWGPEGQPVEFDVVNSIYDDISSKTPVGFDAFIHSVMPVEVFVEAEIEVKNGYVGSSVVAAVTEELTNYFSPNFYPNWNQYLYLNELIVRAAEIEGVLRVVTASMYVPSYGASPITTTTGSKYINNDLMASVVDGNVVFEFAGSMPSVTAQVSIYGS